MSATLPAGFIEDGAGGHKFVRTGRAGEYARAMVAAYRAGVFEFLVVSQPAHWNGTLVAYHREALAWQGGRVVNENAGHCWEVVRFGSPCFNENAVQQAADKANQQLALAG